MATCRKKGGQENGILLEEMEADIDRSTWRLGQTYDGRSHLVWISYILYETY